MNKKYTIALCGASGSGFGVALIKRMSQMAEVSTLALLISSTGKRCLLDELQMKPEDLVALSPKIVLKNDANVGADIASGSYVQDGMIVAPCSAGTLGRIAWGLSENLIARAADVCLKERQPLILALRETPLNRVHLENMIRVHDAGAIVMPIMPSFYNQPQSIQEIYDMFALRITDQLGFTSEDQRRWKG